MAEDAGREVDFEEIEVRPPLEEFAAFMDERIRNAQRLGQDARASLLLEAFELGKKLLAGERGDPACS